MQIQYSDHTGKKQRALFAELGGYRTFQLFHWPLFR
jgi:hypothetical protein